MTRAELAAAIADWLNITTVERLAPSVRTMMIELAITDIQREQRWRANEVIGEAVTFTQSLHTITLPTSRFLEAISLQVTPSTTPQYVEFLPEAEFFRRYPSPSLSTAGVPTKFTIVGDGGATAYGGYIMLNCPPDQTYSGTFSYYQMLAALSGDSRLNWFTSNAWDVVLFRALSDCSIFGIEDPRVPLFMERYKAALAKLSIQEARLAGAKYAQKREQGAAWGG